MEILLTKNISELTDEEIKSLNLPEYIKLEQLNGYDNNYMFVPPVTTQLNDVYFPVTVTANMHIDNFSDKSTPFKSLQECTEYCNKMNNKIGHTQRSMFMILESIRLELLLRKKLKQTGEIKIKSNYSIRETAGMKYILYDKGNGVLTASSINEALNTGLAAIKREKKQDENDKKKPLSINRNNSFKQRHKIW